MDRQRAADDFATIRARIEELRREREPGAAEPDARPGQQQAGRAESEVEIRRRARMEGWPPPWVPTIFVTTPRA